VESLGLSYIFTVIYLSAQPIICVVIPAYRVQKTILDVISSIGAEVHHIIVVDDFCPEKCGSLAESSSDDVRVEVIYHDKNMGVGGAVKTGYKRALEIKADIIVKVDGDGQMDTSKIGLLSSPIEMGVAQYVKGNRFSNFNSIREMPKIRIFGNLVLTFMTKLSSGYWNVFDPTNGFIALSRQLLQDLDLEKIDDGYFFESDLLFRANLLNAKVIDIPIPAVYRDEISNLKIRRVLFEFPFKHFRNLGKRIAYTYYIRDFNLASIELPLGLFIGGFGIVLGTYSWIRGIFTDSITQTGTMILVSMSVLAGLQLILAFFSYDTNNSSKSRL
jgi:dolichol-phosphate mannosyltransferase